MEPAGPQNGRVPTRSIGRVHGFSRSKKGPSVGPVAGAQGGTESHRFLRCCCELHSPVLAKDPRSRRWSRRSEGGASRPPKWQGPTRSIGRVHGFSRSKKGPSVGPVAGAQGGTESHPGAHSGKGVARPLFNFLRCCCELQSPVLVQGSGIRGAEGGAEGPKVEPADPQNGRVQRVA